MPWLNDSRETFSLGRKQMTRMSRLLCAAAIMLMSGLAVSYVYAQYGSGRALLAYPMKGQTLDQENADRADCHDWAVAQTGYDPTFVYAAQQYWIKPVTGPDAPRYAKQSGGFVGATTNAERRRLNELYYAYLRAGQVCLEARGYQVSR
jgi:hypothetical protein